MNAAWRYPGKPEAASVCLQRFVARRLPREVRHVDVHRQARHVPHEEVDGRATLHGEDVVREHVGHDGQQQANGVRVGLIHEV